MLPSRHRADLPVSMNVPPSGRICLLVNDVPGNVTDYWQLVVLPLIGLDRSQDQKDQQDKSYKHPDQKQSPEGEEANRVSQGNVNQHRQYFEGDADNDPYATIKQGLHRVKTEQTVCLFNDEKNETEYNAQAAADHRQVTDHRCDIRIQTYTGCASRRIRGWRNRWFIRR